MRSIPCNKTSKQEQHSINKQGDRYATIEKMTLHRIEELCQILGKVASDIGAGEPFGIDYRDGYDNPQLLPGL